MVRGARQVGKTWLIRDLAHLQNLRLLEFNFEKRPDLISLFSSNDPKEILVNISAFIDSLLSSGATSQTDQEYPKLSFAFLTG
ncbi:MAG: AAA family ATPase [Verrucomicrobia bacterium]|nr:AAA family ATPase [Verrucomicrobiota bacterium]MBS0645796.1 AAA family ATPase [Verrucomicrobiota bacterium]